MMKPDASSSNPDFTRWPLDDMTFAAAQLRQEFPAVAKDRLTDAVISAAAFVPPSAGRVKLMRRARDFLRRELRLERRSVNIPGPLCGARFNRGLPP